MNFITGLFTGALRAGMQGLKHPMIAGGAIGGATGFLGSDANTLTQRIQDTGKGIMTGVAMGALTPGTGAGLYTKLWGVKGGIWDAAKTGTTMAAKMGRFAFEYPVGLAIAGIGAYGALQVLGSYGQSGRSPTISGAKVRTDYNQQAIQAEEMMSQFVQPPGAMGAAPQYRRQMQRFQNSTMGLVQGLHRSRH